MKNLILLGVFALSLVTLNSCGKLTQCECPPGKSLSVNGGDEHEIRSNCETKSDGDCTY